MHSNATHESQAADLSFASGAWTSFSLCLSVLVAPWAKGYGQFLRRTNNAALSLDAVHIAQDNTLPFTRSYKSP